MKTVIVGNGEINDYKYAKKAISGYDFLICCDGGTRHTYNMQIMPNIILGDFDSADDFYLNHYRENNVEFKTFPAKKDETDMEIAFDYAMNIGSKEIIVFGGIGSRFDHTLANVHQLLKALKKDIYACFANENNTVTIMDSKISLQGEPGSFVSLIPLTQSVEGVCTFGLGYPLKNETLYIESSRGVSNVFEGHSASVTISSGILLVIQSRDL